MSSAKQNRQIARIIVGAMTIDGSLSKKEKAQVVNTLEGIGLSELIADVGMAIDDDDQSFNMFQEARELKESFGAEAAESAPLIFRVICDVVAHDRFVSSNEASYLSALARRLEIPLEKAKQIFKSVIAEHRSRLEVAASGVDEVINAKLKEFLDFQGAEDLVGELDPDSIEEMMHAAAESMAEGEKISHDDLQQALNTLGLKGNAKLEEAEVVWRETFDGINLAKMADQGETFVTAALQRLTRINEAYKVVMQFKDRVS